MPFEEMVASDFPNLNRFLWKNRNTEINTDLLDEFDEWKEAYLKGLGLSDDHFHPALRLGYIGEKDEDGNITKVKRIKGMKKKKRKREKTSLGIFTGTKKALTYKCVEDGYDIPDTIKVVKENFPDAKDKSISIWYKKAKKEMPNVKPRVKDEPKIEKTKKIVKKPVAKPETKARVTKVIKIKKRPNINKKV